MILPAAHLRRLLSLARANLARLQAERAAAKAWRYPALDKQIANVESAIAKMEQTIKRVKTG